MWGQLHHTVGKTNNLLTLMNTYVTQAFHVIPEPPYNIPPFYSIKLANSDNTLTVVCLRLFVSALALKCGLDVQRELLRICFA